MKRSTAPSETTHESTTSMRCSRALRGRRKSNTATEGHAPRPHARHPGFAPVPHEGLGVLRRRRLAVAVKEAGGVRLISRNGRDHTKRFHAIAVALAVLKPTTFTLDGEVAVFDAELVSRFEWLRHINHGDLATLPLFMVFDLLQLGEKDYRPEPLKVRRRALEKLVRGQTLILPARRGRKSGIAGTRGWWRRTRSHRTWPGGLSGGSK